MTKKEELFEKYSINRSHCVWDNQIDNWMSVEIFRIMNKGNLPGATDKDLKYVVDFLDKQDDKKWWAKNVMTHPKWGSLYLTAKRMIYRHSNEFLKNVT